MKTTKGQQNGNSIILKKLSNVKNVLGGFDRKLELQKQIRNDFEHMVVEVIQ